MVGVLDVKHPESGEVSQVTIPDDHDGSRIKIEFPDGKTAFLEGFDPAERALRGEVSTVPCGNCGTPQVLQPGGFTCSACGALNTVEVRASTDAAVAQSSEG